MSITNYQARKVTHCHINVNVCFWPLAEVQRMEIRHCFTQQRTSICIFIATDYLPWMQILAFIKGLVHCPRVGREIFKWRPGGQCIHCTISSVEVNRTRKISLRNFFRKTVGELTS